MDNIVLMEIVYGLEYLSDCFGSIFLRELALLADTIEEFSTRCEFCDDVVLILSSILRRCLHFSRCAGPYL